MSKKECCGEAEKVTLVFACAGASNVGQITNEAAKQLEMDGVGRYFCLAGIGGKISGMIESTKAAGKTIVLDGCNVACAQKTLENEGIKPTIHLQVTELGIKKEHVFTLPPNGVKKTVETVKKALARK
jgi:uncharacterized metal-binding protein